MSRTLKICSWNVFFRNRDFERAFRYIAELDFDILCLQEVPEELLARLRALPLHAADAPDADRVFARGTTRNFLVILARHPIRARRAIPLEPITMPLRARLFVQAMRPAKWSLVENRHALYADIGVEGIPKPVRAFCLHLPLAHPEARRKELNVALSHRESGQPTVVCGDLNVLDSPVVTPFNFILGGRPSDAYRWKRERREVERRFREHGFSNPLAGKRTHLLPLQLDHVLASREFLPVRAEVARERAGSDHHPVFVEIAWNERGGI